MTRIMSLAGTGGSLSSGDGTGVRAGLKLRGAGLPPLSTQWFEGAGDGATFRGARVLPRVLDLQLKVYRPTRAEVWDALSLVGRIFDPRESDVRLTMSLDGEEWFVDVRRTGGGDWDWTTDTDGQTYVSTIITVQAGDPYWQRVDQESQQIVLGGLGRGLLKTPAPRLTALRVSTTAAFGSVAFSNSGDVDAYGLWTMQAPFDGFTLTSSKGETLPYTLPKATGFIQVNMADGTIIDETGANKYNGLGPTPRFWAIPKGESSASILVAAATSASKISVVWAPRKWLMF